MSTIVMIADAHPDDFDDFVDLEDRFTCLFEDHGLVLRHRFRDVAAGTEVHVIDLLTPGSLDSYMADPRRIALRQRFSELRLEQRVHTVVEVGRGPGSWAWVVGFSRRVNCEA